MENFWKSDMKKNATLIDVAMLSGVSVGTVSKFLNGGNVKKANRISIQNAIEVLDYSPNHVARNFARGKSNVVTLFILMESPIVSSTWVHEQPIIQAITDAIRTTEYCMQMRIASIEDSLANKQEIEEIIRSRIADGIILLSAWEIDRTIIATLDYHNFPFVMIGSGEDTKRGELVDFDNSAPIYSLVSQLCELGHRRFALIGGFREQIHMMKREKGFRKALKDAGIEVNEEMIRFGDYSLESGFQLTAKMLCQTNPPTAIICGNDNVAAGAIKAIRKAGLRIPEDISVSGFDDSVISEAVDPTITTVRPPAYELGKVAFTQLHMKLGNASYSIPNIILDSTLLLKESTAKCKK
jgi:LacI family repressor for deo operon, udp, cdd, tsx, nupC, and nupG